MELVVSRCRHSQNLRKCRFKMRKTLSCLHEYRPCLSEGNATSIQDMAKVDFAVTPWQWAGHVCSVGPIDEDCGVLAVCW